MILSWFGSRLDAPDGVAAVAAVGLEVGHSCWKGSFPRSVRLSAGGRCGHCHREWTHPSPGRRYCVDS